MRLFVVLGARLGARRVARALGARLLLRRTVGLPRKNVDLLVAYLGSKVELARDLGCSEHLTAMFYCVV